MSTKDDPIVLLLENISEHLDGVKDQITGIDKRLELHIQKTEFELKRIHDQDTVQNTLLDQHIEGVNTLKQIFERHEEADKLRFDKLEEPKKWLSTTGKLILKAGALAAAMIGIAKFLKMF